MRTAEQEVAENAEVLEEVHRGLVAELNHAHRYLSLARRARVAGLTRATDVLARTADDEWRHVSGLMRRITELGGDLVSRPVTATDSGLLARIDHPSGRSESGSLRGLLLASIEEDRSTIRFYGDLCDKTWDADPTTSELALRFLVEETEAEDRLKRLLSEWPDGR
jgi:ferritin-like protein